MISGPLYRQTAEALRSRIAQSFWKQGDRLPAESQLCEEFGVSSITMRRAIATLVAEGLLVRLQGKGTFVASELAIVQGPPQLTSFTEDLIQRGWQPSARLLAIRTGRAPAEVGTRLGLSGGALVTTLSRVRLANRQPVAIQTAHVPALLFPGLDTRDFASESLYTVFQRDYGIRPASATETYHASRLLADEAELLEAEVGSAAFRVERLTNDSSNRRIELVESVIRGDRYTVVLRLTVSRQPER